MKADFKIIKDSVKDRDVLTLVLSEASSTEEAIIKDKLFDGYRTPDELKGLFDYQSNSYSLCFDSDMVEIMEYFSTPKTEEEEQE